jgi:hypothetical protein
MYMNQKPLSRSVRTAILTGFAVLITLVPRNICSAAVTTQVGYDTKLGDIWSVAYWADNGIYAALQLGGFISVPGLKDAQNRTEAVFNNRYGSSGNNATVTGDANSYSLMLGYFVGGVESGTYVGAGFSGVNGDAEIRVSSGGSAEGTFEETYLEVFMGALASGDDNWFVDIKVGYRHAIKSELVVRTGGMRFGFDDMNAFQGVFASISAGYKF